MALNYGTSMQLLCAVILSAQCTDKRVNMVTKSLFKKYRSAEDFAGADLDVFQKEVSSVSFYRNKSKNIIASARIISDKFQGKMPDSMDELLKLPRRCQKDR